MPGQRGERGMPGLPGPGPKGGGNENIADDPRAANRNVEIWKIKQLIKSLEVARSKGPSMVSLINPPHNPSFPILTSPLLYPLAASSLFSLSMGHLL